MALGIGDEPALTSDPVTTVKVDEPDKKDDSDTADTVFEATVKNVKKMVQATESAAKDAVVKATVNKWLPVILLVGAYYLSKGRRR